MHSHKLQETAFDKKSFLLWLKDYMKSLVEKLEKNNPERVPVFKEKVQKFVKEVVVPKFDEWRFYTGTYRFKLSTVAAHFRIEAIQLLLSPVAYVKLVSLDHSAYQDLFLSLN